MYSLSASSTLLNGCASLALGATLCGSKPIFIQRLSLSTCAAPLMIASDVFDCCRAQRTLPLSEVMLDFLLIANNAIAHGPLVLKRVRAQLRSAPGDHGVPLMEGSKFLGVRPRGSEAFSHRHLCQLQVFRIAGCRRGPRASASDPRDFGSQR